LILSSGGSKKKAKANACRLGLQHLLGPQCYESLARNTVSWTNPAQSAYSAGLLTSDVTMSDDSMSENSPEHDRGFADHVRR